MAFQSSSNTFSIVRDGHLVLPCLRLDPISSGIRLVHCSCTSVATFIEAGFGRVILLFYVTFSTPPIEIAKLSSHSDFQNAVVKKVHLLDIARHLQLSTFDYH